MCLTWAYSWELLSRALSRNVGIAVAALDYLGNVRKHLSEAEIISEPKLKAIASIAMQDPVTGLLGRAVFESRLRNEMQRHERYGNRISLLLLDIDDFKRLNDTLGHRQGDAVLARIGQIIKSEVRDVDIACRYGGEELAVILPQTDLQESLVIGERVQARVERDLREWRVTVSGGIASCPEHATTLETLIDAADRALYEAKRAGKNCVVLARVGAVVIEVPDTIAPLSDLAPENVLETQRAFVAQTDATYPAETAALVTQAREISARQPEGTFVQGLRDAALLLELKADHIIVCAVLLVPVRRLGLTSQTELHDRFGSETAALVESSHVRRRLRIDTDDHQRTDTHVLLDGFSRDSRAAVLQLGLRLSELERLPDGAEESRVVARETLDLYVPVAARLGMRRLRQRLEDRCFRLLEPDAYWRLSQEVVPAREEDRVCVDLLKEGVERLLSRNGISGGVEARVKGLYSLHRKMAVRDLPLAQIMDRLGLRIIVPRVMDCHTVLGLLHAHFRPVPGTFDDDIGLPKSNGYQSLHTCIYPVREISTKPVEFQIRTELMHQEAEFGVAAHWLYKAQEAPRPDETAESLVWLRGLAGQYDRCTTHADFVDRLRGEVFDERMVVFGNAGQRIYLPVGSTVREIVLRFNPDPDPEMRLVVNGRPRSLDHPLGDGDSIDLSQLI